MKKGFTVLETLIACLFIPLVMSFILGMLLVMSKYESKGLNQNDLFKLQVKQMLSRSSILNCDTELIFTKSDTMFELSLHDNRIVKTPGFEILLYNVSDFYFSPLGDSCMIYYQHDGKDENVEIRYQY